MRYIVSKANKSPRSAGFSFARRLGAIRFVAKHAANGISAAAMVIKTENNLAVLATATVAQQHDGTMAVQ
jgi:hypothetical protein